MSVCKTLCVYVCVCMSMCVCLCMYLHLSGYISFSLNLTKKLQQKPSRGSYKNICIIVAWNHTKAILPILSQPRLLIFPFCECL